MWLVEIVPRRRGAMSKLKSLSHQILDIFDPRFMASVDSMRGTRGVWIEISGLGVSFITSGVERLRTMSGISESNLNLDPGLTMSSTSATTSWGGSSANLGVGGLLE